MKTTRFQSECEKKFRIIVSLSFLAASVPLFLFLFKSNFYLGFIRNSSFIVHLCHLLKTALPTILNIMLIAITLSFTLLISTGFYKSIKSLFKGLTYPSFVRSFFREGAYILPTDRSVEGYSVWEFKNRKPVAFAAGLVKKKIIISSGIRNLLTEEELDCVLLHEAGHLKMNHPIKRLVVKSIMEGFIIFPFHKRIWKGYKNLTELSADEFALLRGGVPYALAKAIVKVAKESHGDKNLLPVPSFSDSQVKMRVNAILEVEDGEDGTSIVEPRLRDKFINVAIIVSLAFFLTLPYINGIDNGYCLPDSGSHMNSEHSPRRLLSICTQVDCGKCDKCSPRHQS